MKKIIIILLSCFLVWNSIWMVSAEGEKSEFVTIEENSLFSQAAVLMDAATGRILYGKKPDLQLAMASTTKIMTCIMALEQGNSEDTVTASGYAAAQPKVKLYLSKGEQVKLKDLLYSLMLESHNDSAVAIAEHIGAQMLGMPNDEESVKGRTDAESKKAVSAFMESMNQKARQLQCYHTWFITPNGLDATETFASEKGTELTRFHSTTAAELARMMSYCIMQSPQKEEFLKITGTYSYTFSNIECTRSFSCQNHNAFLNMMDGALSGKTGYTGQAGYCYVGALEQDGRYFVAALLNTGAYGSANKGNKWKDMRKLMEYALKHYTNQTIYEGNTVTEPVFVENAKPVKGAYYARQTIPTEVAGEESLKMLLADWEETEIILEQEQVLTAPVKAGQVVGKVEVQLNGTLLRQFDIVCTKSVAEKTFADVMDYILQLFLV